MTLFKFIASQNLVLGLVFAIAACGNSDSPPTEPECSDNYDCAPDEICDEEGLCVPSDVEVEPDCSDDYDCAPNEICDEDGLCVPCVPVDIPEICDGRDTNCNGIVDDGCDKDGDGYCDASMTVAPDADGQWPAVCPFGPGDCDDDDPLIYPGAPLICNDKDSNCSGEIDQDCDKDGDGFCDIELDVIWNEETDSWPAVCPLGPDDCDDTRADVYPGATEKCSGMLENCDLPQADMGCDEDGDGYCTVDMEVVMLDDGSWPPSCPLGPGDCDDTNPLVHPGAPQICNTEDRNCDGLLPQIVLDNLALVRERSANGRNAAMVRAKHPSGSGHQYAFVWQEEEAEHRVIRFVRTGRDGTNPSLIETLTEPGRVGSRPSIAWDPESGNFGVAWFSPDPVGPDNDWSVYFTMLDADGGVLVSPMRADDAIESDTVHVVAAGDYFGIFYRAEDGDDVELKYVSFHIANEALSTPMRINVDSTNRNVTAGSFIPMGSQIMMLWPQSTSQYYSGSISAADGSIWASLTSRSYPTGNGGNKRGGKLFDLHGAPYLLFGEGSTLWVQRLRVNFVASGSSHVLVTNAATSSSNHSLTETAAGGFALFYRPQAWDSMMRMARFDSAWQLFSDFPRDTEYQGFPWFPGGQLRFYYHYTNNSFQFLDRQHNDGFFRFVSFSGWNGNVLRDHFPISGETFISAYSSDFLLTYFDHSADSIAVVQESPSDTSRWERYYVAGGGVATMPQNLNRPENCENLREVDGELRCVRDEQQIAPECGRSVEVFVYDGSTWEMRYSAVIPGELSNGSCRSGGFIVRDIPLADRSVFLFRLRNPSGIHQFYLVSLTGPDSYTMEHLIGLSDNQPWAGFGQKVSAGDAYALSFVVEDRNSWPWGYQLYALVLDLDGTLLMAPTLLLETEMSFFWQNHLAATSNRMAVIMSGELSDGSGFEFKSLYRELDFSTGDLLPLVDLSMPDGFSFSSAILTVGESFVFNTRITRWSTDSQEWLLYFSNPGSSLESHRLEQVPEVDDLEIATTGPDYVVLSYGDKTGISAMAFDTQATPITDYVLPYEFANSPSMDLFHTGKELRWLIASDDRIFATTGTCH